MSAQDDYRSIDVTDKDMSDETDEVPFEATGLFSTQNLYIRQCLSEFLSTFIYCAFGLGVNAQIIVSNAAAGNYTSATIAWGIGVMVAMHVGGGVSHSHINPAITIAVASLGVLPWKKVPGYIISQLLGAFFGALMIYIMYYQTIHKFDHKKTSASAKIFYTYPAPGINKFGAFINEMFATMIFIIGILSFVDKKNRPTVVSSFPTCVGILFIGVYMAFSFNTSVGLNPARDFCARLMLAIVGYDGAFSANGTYFWIPIIAPLVGSLLGCAVYVIFIMGHHPAKTIKHGFY